MKAGQESILAIILGFALGFAVAAGIFLLPSLYKPREKTDVASLMGNDKQTLTLTQTQTQFSLDEPKDLSGTSAESITVIGKSNPDDFIILSTQSDDQVIKANDQGIFRGSIAIFEGTTNLWVTRYGNEGTQTIARKIYRVSKETTP